MQRSKIKLFLCASLMALTLLLGSRTPNSAEALGQTNLVLAFYYAWFDTTSFGPGKTPFTPIEPYFSTSETTIRRHIKTAKAAGIDGFVQSWYGPNPNQQTEPNFKLGLDLAQQHGFKMAVDFEVASPFFGGNQDRINALSTLINTHAHHPAYLRMDGKPVIFFWANWALPVKDWVYIREQADPWNQAIWIAEGGHTDYLEVFDGLHLYNLAWSSNPAGINNRWAYETRKKADELGTYKYWVGTAMPGFDNRNVDQPEHTVRERNGGKYLRDSFRGAAATNPDLIVLTSFNEWPEGSHIEPSEEFGTEYIEQMAQLTAAYKGYDRGRLPTIPVWVAAPPTPTPAPVIELASNVEGAALTDDSAETSPKSQSLASLQPSGDGFHIVQPGETLLGIALRYGTDVETLLTLNDLPPTAFIRDGQRLLLRPAQQEGYPPPETQPTEPPPAEQSAQPTAAPANAFENFYSTPTPQSDGNIIYVVQPGDTLVGIATRFSYSVEQLNELYALNGLSPDDFLQVGQQLLLGRDQASVVPLEGNIPPRYAGAEYRESDNAYIHVVQSGDTLISIAVKYGYDTMDAFYEVSRLQPDAFISVGQAVVVGFKPQPSVTGGSTDLPTTTPPPPPTAAPPTATPTATPPPTRTPIPFPSLTATLVADVPVESGESEVAVVNSAETTTNTNSTPEPTLELASAPLADPETEAPSRASAILPLLAAALGLGLIVGAGVWYIGFGRR